MGRKREGERDREREREKWGGEREREREGGGERERGGKGEGGRVLRKKLIRLEGIILCATCVSRLLTPFLLPRPPPPPPVHPTPHTPPTPLRFVTSARTQKVTMTSTSGSTFRW